VRPTLASLLLGALLAATAIVTHAPGGTELALGDPWEPDPFPLGTCVTISRYSDDPLCVIVDPEDA